MALTAETIDLFCLGFVVFFFFKKRKKIKEKTFHKWNSIAYTLLYQAYWGGGRGH